MKSTATSLSIAGKPGGGLQATTGNLSTRNNSDGTHWRPEDDSLDHLVCGGAGRAEVVVLPRQRREGLVALQHRPGFPVPAAGRRRHGDQGRSRSEGRI
jgi:hypothetical protein